MSTNKTENYKLHTWEPQDDFLRSEFNENFAIIDAALHGKAEVVTGAYTGDGAASRTVTLGFTPRAVLIFRQDGRTGEDYGRYGGLALPGHPVQYELGVNKKVEIFSVVSGGFQANFTSTTSYMLGANQGGRVYHYLAVG